MELYRKAKAIAKFIIRGEPLFNADSLFVGKINKDQAIKVSEWSQSALDAFIMDTVTVDAPFVDVIRQLSKEGRMGQSFREYWNIYNWVTKTKNVPGDIVEIGVYKAGSAKIISAFKGDRALHLFDTYEGIPVVDSAYDDIAPGAVVGDSLQSIKAYLKNDPKISYYKGIFPDTAKMIPAVVQKYSMVHMDMDGYPGTKSALEYFYDHLSPGRVILMHDFRTDHLKGVKKATEEFFADKLESLIELWDRQAMIVKH